VVLDRQVNEMEFINEREKPVDGKFPPTIATPEQEKLLKELNIKDETKPPCDKFGSWNFDESEMWVQTYTGRRFTPTKPIINSIVLEDIAHALSMQCRFNGHILKFYSVAQHSVLASYICDEKDKLYALLHDASEAYLSDISRPIKTKLIEYNNLEKILQDAICKRFNLPTEMPESVKKADDILLMTEARDLLSTVRSGWGYDHITPLPFKITPMSQQESKELFIKRYCELTNTSISFFRKELKEDI